MRRSACLILKARSSSSTLGASGVHRVGRKSITCSLSTQIMEMYSYIFPSGCVSVARYALALRWLTDFNTAGYAAVVAVQALLLMLVAAVSSNEAAFRSRWSGWWLLTPAALVLLEAVQHRFPFGGFPLSAFGYSQTDGPFMAAAPLGGTLLVTALATVAGAVVTAVIFGPRRARAASVVAVVVVLAVPAFASTIVDDTAEGSLDVVLVQGGGPVGFARSIPIRLIRPAGTYRLPTISPGTLIWFCCPKTSSISTAQSTGRALMQLSLNWPGNSTRTSSSELPNLRINISGTHP